MTIMIIGQLLFSVIIGLGLVPGVLVDLLRLTSNRPAALYLGGAICITWVVWSFIHTLNSPKFWGPEKPSARLFHFFNGVQVVVVVYGLWLGLAANDWSVYANQPTFSWAVLGMEVLVAACYTIYWTLGLLLRSLPSRWELMGWLISTFSTCYLWLQLTGKK